VLPSDFEDLLEKAIKLGLAGFLATVVLVLLLQLASGL
jgi:hypothetical protein